VESASGFGGIESSVVEAAAISSVTEASLLDFFEASTPPVASTTPGGTCRSKAPVDAEVPDAEPSTEADPVAGPPSVCELAADDAPAGSGVVPEVVEVPLESVSLVPVVPVVPVPSELADPVSSAHATPGVVATAIPTPNATANPPTRPM
jgi:hypothetical protein